MAVPLTATTTAATTTAVTAGRARSRRLQAMGECATATGDLQNLPYAYGDLSRRYDHMHMVNAMVIPSGKTPYGTQTQPDGDESGRKGLFAELALHLGSFHI